jgi:hypothetical protein
MSSSSVSSMACWVAPPELASSHRDSILAPRLAYVLGRIAALFNGHRTNISLLQASGGAGGRPAAAPRHRQLALLPPAARRAARGERRPAGACFGPAGRPARAHCDLRPVPASRAPARPPRAPRRTRRFAGLVPGLWRPGAARRPAGRVPRRRRARGAGGPLPRRLQDRQVGRWATTMVAAIGACVRAFAACCTRAARAAAGPSPPPRPRLRPPPQRGLP